MFVRFFNNKHFYKSKNKLTNTHTHTHTHTCIQMKGSVNSILLLLNALFCIFVSLLPASFKLLTKFELLKDSEYWDILVTDKHAGESACAFASIMLFLSSTTLFIMYIYTSYFIPDLSKSNNSIPNYVQFVIAPSFSLLNFILLVSNVKSASYIPILMIPVCLSLLYVYKYLLTIWKQQQEGSLMPLLQANQHAHTQTTYHSIE